MRSSGHNGESSPGLGHQATEPGVTDPVDATDPVAATDPIVATDPVGATDPAGTQPGGSEDTIDALERTVATPPKIDRIPGTADHNTLIPVAREHYVIGPQIAEGGMGRIVDARDRRLGRPVAIKELLSDKGVSAKHFKAEALITARLQHPAIVTVYEAGTWPSGEPFYAMKKVVGRSLDKVVSECKSIDERMALVPNVMAVVDALAYAHSQGVIHRDLKPANVLVGEFGETVVIDWGLAKEMTPTSGEIKAVVVGTPAYMSPEQAHGRLVDQRSDVYALGALLYQVLGGHAPYSGPNARDIINQVKERPPIPLSEREPGIPRDLVTIVAKAMSRAREERYPTARELAEDLKRFQTGRLVSAHQYTRRERLRRWLRRNRAPFAVAVAATVALAAVGGVSLQRIFDEQAKLRVERREADRQRDLARRQRVQLLEEQGRQELLAGRAGRALAYLSEAYLSYQEGDSSSLRFLLAEAMLPFQAEERAIVAGTAPLSGVAWGPGDLIAVASTTGEVSLWDAASGAQVAWFRAHDGPCASVAFDPDGKRLITAGAGRVARMWDAKTGLRLAELTGHQGEVLAAAFDAEGERIVTASADGTARIWSADGRLLRALAEHTGPVRDAAFNDDGALVVTASDDRSAIVWSTQSGQPVVRLQGHSDAVRSAVFRRDDAEILTASDDGKAYLWEAASGRLIRAFTGHSGAVLFAAYSPNQQQVVTASLDRSARIWDARNGVQSVDLEGHRGHVARAAFDESGRRLVTVGDDGTARIWSTANRRLLSVVVPGGQLAQASFSPDGRRFVTAGSERNAKIFVVGESDPTVVIDGHEQIVLSATFSPDGSQVLTAGGDGTVRTWDSATGAPRETLRGHVGIVYAAAFDPSGRRIVSGGEDRTARIWEGGKVVRLLEGHQGKVESVAFDPSGKRVLTASLDGYAREFDANTGQLIRRLGRGQGITMSAYNPDGELIVTASTDGSVNVWEGDGTVIPLEQPGLLSWAAFSPSGRRVVTASLDGRVELLDARTGKLLGTRDGHLGSVLSAVFSPDGTRLLTAGRDGTARLWDVHVDEREPGGVADFVRARVPWRLVDGRLGAVVGQPDR